MQIPEGVETVTAEGRDLVSALNTAAKELGVDLGRVAHKLDLSHFRSAVGTSVPKTTVRIIAWESDELVKTAPKAPSRERDEKPERERKPRRRREERAEAGEAAEKPVELRSAEATTTEASAFAQAWFARVLEFMDVEATVTGTGNDERVHLDVRADKAGRVIGKRGATLGAIRHLLGLALEKRHGDLVVDVDVEDSRDEREAAGGREDREDKRKRRRRKGGRREDDRGAEKGRIPESKLKALARRAAEKARETGQTITINLELNSYDRRLVHMEVAEIDGVDSQSEEREVTEDGRSRTVKYVQVIPAT